MNAFESMETVKKYKSYIIGITIALIAYAVTKSDLINLNSQTATVIIYLVVLISCTILLIQRKNLVRRLSSIMMMIFTVLVYIDVIQISLQFYMLVLTLLVFINLIIEYNISAKSKG